MRFNRSPKLRDNLRGECPVDDPAHLQVLRWIRVEHLLAQDVELLHGTFTHLRATEP